MAENKTQQNNDKQLDKLHKKTSLIAGLFCLAAVISVFVYDDISSKRKYTHKNKITCVDTLNNKIIISDINTREERMIDYKYYKRKHQKFAQSVNYFKPGDTLDFYSNKYDNKRVFDLPFDGGDYGTDNSLTWNEALIESRKKAERLKQEQDSLARYKQRQR